MTGPADTPDMQLRIARAEPAAEGIRLFELRHPEGAELPEFTPGSHISIRVPKGEIRKYSLSNDPAERDRYVIAVKREANGRGGSISMVDEAKVGDIIEASHPRNDFPMKHNQAGYIFIAGGIGITPILSMMRFLKSSGGPKFKLYYLSRSPETTAFREELSGPEYRGAAVIHHDYGDMAKSFDLWPVLEQPRGMHVYCCGPRPLMDAVKDMTGHWSSAAVHFESFLDASAARKPDDKPFKVKLAHSGDVIDIPADKTILETLRAHGLDVPSSCESGTCGTCKTRLLGGEADHRDLVLTEDERQNHIMVCISRAKTPEIVIDR